MIFWKRQNYRDREPGYDCQGQKWGDGVTVNIRKDGRGNI